MSTNTDKLAEALRRLVNTFPIPVDGVEQADRASLRLALLTAREALAAHEAEQAALRDLECPPDPEMVDRALAAADQMRAYALAARQQAQAAGQELPPGDFICEDHDSPWLICKPCAADGKCARAAVSAANSLAQRQPLTWEQIESVRAQVFAKALQLRGGCDDQAWDHWFACAIEAAHGIGATTGEQR